MPFAVALFMDAGSSDAIRAAWRMVGATGLARSMDEGDATPHLTLAICERLDVDAAARALAGFAAERAALPVMFSTVGAFPTDPTAVYLAPEPSSELLAAHRRVHDALTPLGEDFWRYYLPGLWSPHCTLAEGVPGRTVPKVIDACSGLTLPLRGSLDELGMVEFRPIHYLGRFRLAGWNGSEPAS